MIHPKRLLEIKAMKDQFEKRHPKVFPFLKAASKEALVEGAVVEITVTTPQGNSLSSNIKSANVVRNVHFYTAA